MIEVAGGVVPKNASKSIYIGQYGGSLTPVSNLTNSQLSIDSSQQVHTTISFDIDLAERPTKFKKNTTQLSSYNGLTDHYIIEHNCGNLPPSFVMFLNKDIVTGSVPIQYESGNSFRLIMAYTTDKHLVIREKYQIHQQALPPISLKAKVYLFNSPTEILAQNGLGVIHNPVTFTDVSPYSSMVRGRKKSIPVTFFSTGGTSFDKVEVMRCGGGTTTLPTFNITHINRTPILPYDNYENWVSYEYDTPQTIWSMTVQITDSGENSTENENAVTYSPMWFIKFTNTKTGQVFTDSWSGTVNFNILPENTQETINENN